MVIKDYHGKVLVGTEFTPLSNGFHFNWWNAEVLVGTEFTPLSN